MSIGPACDAALGPMTPETMAFIGNANLGDRLIINPGSFVYLLVFSPGNIGGTQGLRRARNRSGKETLPA